MRTGLKCLSERGVEFVDSLHYLIHVLWRVKSSHREVRCGAGTIHAGVLENGILLEPIRTSSVIECDKVANCDASVKNLAPDKHVEWGTQPQLSVFGKQFLYQS